jgi:uncharacterized membrane protein YphA (DoxX/SURF4 family)
MKRKIFFMFRVALAAIFIVSGYVKLMEPNANFLAVVYEYKILTGNLAKIFSVLMPWFELIFGVFLLKGLWTRFSLVMLWLLNTSFIVAVASALWRKLPITECGCFGGDASLPLDKVLMLDITLWVIFAVLFVFAKDAKWLSIDEFFEKK